MTLILLLFLLAICCGGLIRVFFGVVMFFILTPLVLTLFVLWLANLP